MHYLIRHLMFQRSRAKNRYLPKPSSISANTSLRAHKIYTHNASALLKVAVPLIFDSDMPMEAREWCLHKRLFKLFFFFGYHGYIHLIALSENTLHSGRWAELRHVILARGYVEKPGQIFYATFLRTSAIAKTLHVKVWRFLNDSAQLVPFVTHCTYSGSDSEKNKTRQLSTFRTSSL